jgi:hypothetical protein
MFERGKQKYATDVELGKRYRDPQTGIEGVATAVTFYQYAYDAPRRVAVATGERARATRTGGAREPVPARGPVPR